MPTMKDFNDDDFSHDALLDGRITLVQARNGYRVAIDPVFLAAQPHHCAWPHGWLI